MWSGGPKPGGSSASRREKSPSVSPELALTVIPNAPRSIERPSPGATTNASPALAMVIPSKSAVGPTLPRPSRCLLQHRRGCGTMPAVPGEGQSGRWTLVAVCTTTFMLLVDITIVNVALPSVQRQLHASLTGLQWVVDAYAVSLAALILTAGALADRYGRRLVFTAGIVIFSTASFLCGVAWNIASLDAARALQGVGGAALFATALRLIGAE